jgi:hypothetical protein
MYEVPASSDAAGRRALRRLQEVGVHVLAPAEALAADPLPDAVAVMQLAVAASALRAGGVKVGALLCCAGWMLTLCLCRAASWGWTRAAFPGMLLPGFDALTFMAPA